MVRHPDWYRAVKFWDDKYIRMPLHTGSLYYLHHGGPSLRQREVLIELIGNSEFKMVKPRAIKFRNVIVYMRYGYMVVRYHKDESCKVLHNNGHYAAVLTYDCHGGVKERKYYHNGVLHGAPAIVGYDQNEVAYMYYYMNGYPHRESGPAKLFFNCFHLARCMTYWYYGKRVTEF